MKGFDLTALTKDDLQSLEPWTPKGGAEMAALLPYTQTLLYKQVIQGWRISQDTNLQLFKTAKVYLWRRGGNNWDASDPCLSKKGSTKCGISPMKILPTPWKKMQDMILWSQGHWYQIAEKVRTIGLHMEHYKPSLALLMLILPDFYFWYFLHLKEQQ